MGDVINVEFGVWRNRDEMREIARQTLDILCASIPDASRETLSLRIVNLIQAIVTPSGTPPITTTFSWNCSTQSNIALQDIKKLEHAVEVYGNLLARECVTAYARFAVKTVYTALPNLLNIASQR